MRPSGPMMIEHRLIERMIAVLRAEMERATRRDAIDPVLVDQAVDFIRTYADRTHHGKEEDILFRDLEKKPLSTGDRRVMLELVEEHKVARKTVCDLVAAKERWLAGDKAALPVIIEKIRALVDFYPVHIEKEDKVFFPAAMRYLSKEEQQAMLQEFWEFDRRMIHEKYAAVVERLGG